MANDKLKGLFKDKIDKREEAINERMKEDTFLVVEVGDIWGASSFAKISDLMAHNGVIIDTDKASDCLQVFVNMFTEAASHFLGHAKELEGKHRLRITIHFPVHGVLDGKFEFEPQKTLADFNMDEEAFVLDYFKTVGDIYMAILDQFYKKEGRFPVKGEKLDPETFQRWDKQCVMDDDGTTLEVKDVKPEDIPY